MKLIEAPLALIQEISQAAPTLFAMAHFSDKEVLECNHWWIKCRDFFSDVLLVRDSDRAVAGVWGFEATKSTYSPFIVVRNAPENACSVLNSLIGESTCSTSRWQCSDKDFAYWLAPEWVLNPIMLSLATGVIRILNYPREEWTEDDKKIANFIDSGGREKVCAIINTTPLWSMAVKNSPPVLVVHNRSGIVSYIEGKVWFI